MLRIEEIKPRIFQVTLSGVIEKVDIEEMKRHLTPALEGEGDMAIVLRAEALEDMTADALAEDARFEFGMLPYWSKVRKVALVTDKQAFEAILRWIDPVLPMMAFRSFAPSEAQAARDWAGALPAPAVTGGPGLRMIEDGTDGLLVFEIDGPMTKDDTGRVFEMFDRATEAHGKINLMVIVKDYEGFDLSLLGDRELMTSKFGAMGKVGRYAVVGAPGWMRSMVGVLDPLLPIKMRSFDAGEETAARDWASAG